MKRKHIAEVKSVEVDHEGFKGMSARYLWTAVDGCPHYAMRIMEFEPGGYTSYHSHLEEHEFYFLEGEAAYVDGEGNEIRVSPGDGIYCPPDEPHQIKNVGKTEMKLVCTIPILPGGDGKYPAPRPDAKDAG
ncbi:MAG: cupin domain-containing protein [Syntrophobacteraceae bacterium]|nr:cupin domain-containing protein [Syntrophobacteraceae bacterium]